MPSQQPTPLSALDALEQHTPRRVVRSTLRHIALVLDDEIARWEDDGGPVRQPSVIEEALAAAIMEFYGPGGRPSAPAPDYSYCEDEQEEACWRSWDSEEPDLFELAGDPGIPADRREWSIEAQAFVRTGLAA